MSGWRILVAQQTPEERDAAADPKKDILARWEVGVGGLAWLDALVEAGKASQISFAGYPNRYVAIANVILPILKSGSPPYCELPADDVKRSTDKIWVDETIIHQDKIAKCPENQILTIDAWDIS